MQTPLLNGFWNSAGALLLNVFFFLPDLIN
jgi:hypothetical protein